MNARRRRHRPRRSLGIMAGSRVRFAVGGGRVFIRVPKLPRGVRLLRISIFGHGGVAGGGIFEARRQA